MKKKGRGSESNRKKFLIAAIIVCVVGFFFQPFRVSDDSMSPNLNSGEYHISSNSVYKFIHPTHGDIIRYRPLNYNSLVLIGRIIAIPDDEISLNGRIFLNREPLDESKYINSNITTTGGAFPFFSVNIKYYIIPAGQYLVLADNRSGMNDSRTYGLVPRENILSKIIY